MLWVNLFIRELVGVSALSTIGSFVVAPFIGRSILGLNFWKRWRLAFWAFFRGFLILVGIYGFYVFGLHRDYRDVPSPFLALTLVLAGILIWLDLRSLRRKAAAAQTETF
jgi:hypothetical protein